MTRLRQARAEVLVVTRRGVAWFNHRLRPVVRWMSEHVPELLTVAGLAVFTVTTWTINARLGGYMLGVSLVGFGVLVGWSRRP